MNNPTIDSVVLLYDKNKNKKHIIKLSTVGKAYSTSNGMVYIEKILGTEYGKTVKSHLGYEYTLLPATLYDFIMKKLNRLTQIVYPKDAAYIVLRLDVKPGDTVIESGIGSGAMSAVFAQILGKTGKLISYEKREEFIKNALRNLKKFNLDYNITVKQRDVSEGFDEYNADALFIDIKEPWQYLEKAIKSLKDGRMLGIVVPTANQVSETLKAMSRLPLVDIEVEEILQRPWKTIPERLRPFDRMPAHTAFLIFSRKISV